MHKFLDLLKRFRKDERGYFAAMFGILAVALIATAGATVDFTSVQNARTRAQVALDAAALALQPEIYKTTYTTTQLRDMAQALMVNRVNDSKITVVSMNAVPDKAAGTLTLVATLKAPLYFVSLVGINTLNMTVVSEATKGSQDLEVSVALDVTGSMLQNGKIDALIDAANDMVDILVLDEQEPTYTKMAIVPWSMGVNVGSNAAAVRGSIPAAKTVTGAAWMIGSSKTITAINKANPARVTSNAHGLNTGDFVYISGISGMTELNNRYFTVTRDNANRFFLNGVNSTGYNTYSSGGIARQCYNAECEVRITSNAHGFANNAVVYFTGVGGMTQLNNNAFTATAVTTNTFDLDGTSGPSMSNFTSGGSAWCTTNGCEYYRFQNAQSSSWRIHRVSTCVTERVAANQYTDAAPGTTPVGRNYPSTTCLNNQVVPLTSDKVLLHDTIDDFVAEGSTAGQIGTAWAWYMLSPSFASLWPAASQPAPYLSNNVIKVVVLMTDGSFNSVYCNGVISADSTSGSGSSSDHINCNATNGDPFEQAKDMCDAMKSPSTGIIVYTVGFDISDQTDEQDVLEHCATDSSKFYLAEDDAELTAAFQAIAQDIAQLRISE